MGVQLVWLKRDLRLNDHAALAQAAAAGPCVVLYVYEPELYGAPEHDRQHLRFLNECLDDMRESLRARGATLTVRYGPMPEVVDRLHDEVPFEHIWSHQETGNRLTYERDLRVASWAKGAGVSWSELCQNGVVRPLASRNGWSSSWRKRMLQPIVEPPASVETIPHLPPGRLLSADELGLAPGEVRDTQAGGERAARELLDSFLDHRGERYRQEMSSPLSAATSCSRLSAHLAFGTLSIREVYQRSRARAAELKQMRRSGEDIGRSWLPSLVAYGSRLRWHCHFMQKLEDEPDLEFRNLSRAYDGLRSEEPDAERLSAWCEGRTGYPMVDACMRALRRHGWINFRMRAMLMSFASYHLWLPWRPTGLFLARQFLDFEPGIHWSQVQMQSGTTGINANRIYSPIKQARDQDPGGDFIRRWLPELEHVPARHLAEPHKMSSDVARAAGCVIGTDYPRPIVDHATAYREARAKIAAVKRSAAARAEAERVYVKHGSRKRPRSARNQAS